jgi:PIN domain nuclease of toxin-antitoxin system
MDIPVYCEKIGFALIPLEPLEALHSALLPAKDAHKDPFDRMLIYQCIKNHYIFVSRDKNMKIYKNDGLECLW